jgi:hypothetical protein
MGARHGVHGGRGIPQRVQQQRRARPAREPRRHRAPVRRLQPGLRARGRLQRAQRRTQRGRYQRHPLQRFLGPSNGWVGHRVWYESR